MPTEEVKEQLDGLKCTIVSLVPFELLEYKPGLVPPAFLIPASDGKIPSIIHVDNSLHYVYLDSTRGSMPVIGPSNVVAKSIVNDYIDSQLGIDDDARPGIFWIPGEYKLSEVQLRFKSLIEKAKIQQENWFRNCCRIADDDWHKYHQHNVISKAQRLMATMLGWKPEQHEWMAPASSLTSVLCPACQSPVKPDQVVCQTCRAVLKPEEYKKLTFAT